jgi:hypothetical protein
MDTFANHVYPVNERFRHHADIWCRVSAIFIHRSGDRDRSTPIQNPDDQCTCASAHGTPNVSAKLAGARGAALADHQYQCGATAPAR